VYLKKYIYIYIYIYICSTFYVGSYYWWREHPQMVLRIKRHLSPYPRLKSVKNDHWKLRGWSIHLYRPFRKSLDRYYHRIDTRPEGTLLCVLAEGKRPNFFTCYDAILECTRHFVPMFGQWKTSVCTPGWRHMMAYFHVSTRKISDKISSEWHFWSSIYTHND
jgi:hypothetical protein